MGIEIAGVALGTILSGAAAAATLYTTLSQSGKGGGGAPMMQSAAPPPEAAKSPDSRTFKRRNATAAGAGLGSTLLTGTGGVDPGASALGKTTLLGL